LNFILDREHFYIDVRWTWYGTEHEYSFVRDLRIRNDLVETTALALTSTMAFLALHQDEQEKAYQEITSVIPSDREPVCV
jgi:hypothetical protein